jgi:hypothetical protein
MKELFLDKYRVQSARKTNHDYTSPAAYFITINTDAQMNWFGKIKNGKIELSSIGKIMNINPIKRSQLMPNSLGSIIGQFKSICIKKIRKKGYKYLKWQSRFYDHIMQDRNELNRIKIYIRANPNRH